MKRGAEKQLTKDDGDDEGQESSVGQGFKKASESVLAGRTIKALPGRTSKPASPAMPTFGGFGGSPANNLFGSTSSNAVSPAPGVSAEPPKPLFGGSTSSIPPIAFPTNATLPNLGASSTSTSTAKAFASILGTSSFGSNTPSSATSSTTPASNGISSADLTTYYKNLRGLNSSFMSTISQTVESDPFTDLSSLLESYKALRLKVEKDHEKAEKQAESKKDESQSLKASVTSKIPTFIGHGRPAPSTSETKPTSPESKPFSTVPTMPATSSSGSLFSSNSAQPSSATAFTAPSSSPFGFGAASSKPAAGDKPVPFSFGAPSMTSSPPKPSLFGTTSTSTSTSPFSFGAPASNPPASSTSTNFFGGSSTTSPSLPFKLDAPKPSAADADKKPPAPSSFGTPSAVAQNSGVFFGFGSQPASTSTSKSATPAPAVESQSRATTEGIDEGGSTAGSEAREGTPGLLTPNPHDEEGAGEEHEETTHAVKLKAYRMKKAGEQGEGWAELGLGTLRLKKHKETDARRVLLRNSTNGKVNINFKIYPGLKPNLAKKALTFVGHADGVSQTYCVRLPNETQAGELKAALEREIEFVKAKGA